MTLSEFITLQITIGEDLKLFKQHWINSFNVDTDEDYVYWLDQFETLKDKSNQRV